MAGTTYNTLSLPAEEPQREQTSKKVAIIAAVVVACCAMFFAGRVNANPVEYTHEEVMNVGRICAEGQYIGLCIGCKQCAAYEYNNGGCSFFKDTFCSYCNPIPNCKRENTLCTTNRDQECSECDCDDPPSEWTDITKEAFAIYHGNTEDMGAHMAVEWSSYSCYLGKLCTPCDVCPRGSYQTRQCNPETNMNTQCTECTRCTDDQYVEKVCTYDSDTICTDCTTCDFQMTNDVSSNLRPVKVLTLNLTASGAPKYSCERHEPIEQDGEMIKVCGWYVDGIPLHYEREESLGGRCTGVPSIRLHDNMDIFQRGYDAVCTGCTECNVLSFVEGECTPATDTVCKSCHNCDEGEYIFDECQKSSGPTENGVDRQCAQCTPLLDPLETDVYITAVCDPLEHTDFTYNDCTQCVFGEYVSSECSFGALTATGDDRVCSSCDSILTCDEENIVCSVAGDSTCTRCNIDGQGTKEDGFFNSWGTCCNEGNLGEKCGWIKHTTGCDPKGQSYGERSARRNGFYNQEKSETAADFVMWCHNECLHDPRCTAFEVEDCLADETCDVVASSLCGLKDQKPGEEYGDDWEFGGGAETHSCWTKPPQED